MKLNGTTRSYLSSQNRKYDLAQNLKNRYKVDIGEQTPMIGRYIANKLIDGGVEKALAEEYASKFIGTFVNLKKHDKNSIDEEPKGKKAKKKKTDFLKTETIKIQPSEREHIERLIERIIDGYVPEDTDFHFLKENTAIRTALTGRMIAKVPSFDVEASLSSNFSFTVNDIGNPQTDYFTAIDSLNITGSKGSGHLDNFHYSQGVYYGFNIIDINLLIKNLQGDKELALTTIKQIIDVLTTSSPSANKNRCADGITWPSYVLLEKAEFAPRSLCSAFHTPITGPDIMEKAIIALRNMKENFDTCYGTVESMEMNILERKGSLKELLKFIEF